MAEQKKKEITILFTRYYDIFSNIIYHMSGGKGYTHVSISLDNQCEYYYSFNIKGFRKEYHGKNKKKREIGIKVSMEISEEQYIKMNNMLMNFNQNEDNLYYSKLGICLCLFHIPSRIRNHYFCSQFVAEMLQISNTISLKKQASLYLPNHLLYELCVVNTSFKKVTYLPI